MIPGFAVVAGTTRGAAAIGVCRACPVPVSTGEAVGLVGCTGAKAASSLGKWIRSCYGRLVHIYQRLTVVI